MTGPLYIKGYITRSMEKLKGLDSFRLILRVIGANVSALLLMVAWAISAVIYINEKLIFTWPVKARSTF